MYECTNIIQRRKTKNLLICRKKGFHKICILLQPCRLLPEPGPQPNTTVSTHWTAKTSPWLNLVTSFNYDVWKIGGKKKIEAIVQFSDYFKLSSESKMQHIERKEVSEVWKRKTVPEQCSAAPRMHHRAGQCGRGPFLWPDPYRPPNSSAAPRPGHWRFGSTAGSPAGWTRPLPAWLPNNWLD